MILGALKSRLPLLVDRDGNFHSFTGRRFGRDSRSTGMGRSAKSGIQQALPQFCSMAARSKGPAGTAPPVPVMWAFTLSEA